MAETPLHFKTIIEMASLIKSRALSPVEVTESMLNRIQEQDHYYKSYATVMTDQARTSAQAAEQAIAAGNYLGPPPRRTHRRQGPMFHQRCGHDGRHQSFDGPYPGYRLHSGAEAVRRRCDYLGKTEPHRRRYGRLQPRISGAGEPLGRQSLERGFFQWLWRSYVSGVVLRVVGQRYRWVNQIPFCCLRHSGAKAHLGKG